MEKANSIGEIKKARFIVVDPKVLKDIAARMEFEVSQVEDEKVFFKLTDDIILYHDPKLLDKDRREQPIRS